MAKYVKYMNEKCASMLAMHSKVPDWAVHCLMNLFRMLTLSLWHRLICCGFISREVIARTKLKGGTSFLHTCRFSRGKVIDCLFLCLPWGVKGWGRWWQTGTGHQWSAPIPNPLCFTVEKNYMFISRWRALLSLDEPLGLEKYDRAIHSHNYTEVEFVVEDLHIALLIYFESTHLYLQLCSSCLP